MELALVSISTLVFLFSLFLLFKRKISFVEAAFYLVWVLLFTSLIISVNYKEFLIESIINTFSLLFFVWLILLAPLLYTIIFNNLEEDKADIKNYFLPSILFFTNVFSIIYFSIQKDEEVFSYQVVENVMSYVNYIVILFIFPIATIYYSYKSFQITGSIFKKNLLEKHPERFYFALFILLFDIYILIWFLQNYIISNKTIKGVLKIYYLFYFVVSFIVLWKAKKSIKKKRIIEIDSIQHLFFEINEKLCCKMEVDKAFKNSKLSLKLLANEIGTNEKYLSQVINKKYNVNFSNFINNYRIEHAKILLLQESHSNYTIEAIGNLAGFNSKSAFNATFKKHTGITPTDYKKSISLE